MQLKKIHIGIDYVSLKLSNTTLSIDVARCKLFEIFCFHPDDLEFFEGKKRVCYFSRQYGVDLKIEKSTIQIEFHGTFLSLHGYDRLRILKFKIQEIFKTYCRITEVHVCQDFKNLQLERCFKRKDLVWRFKAQLSQVESPDDKSVETIYLRSRNFRWNLILYNKTVELQKNKAKQLEKFHHYESRGYLEEPITRIELKFKSDYCKLFLETFESNLDETDICKTLLSFWHRKHRIYVLNPSLVFDHKHPERHKEWSVWKKIFGFNLPLVKSGLPDEAILKNLHTPSLDGVVEKITSYSLRYGQDPEALIDMLIGKRDFIANEARKVIQRKRETDEYLFGLLAEDKAS